MGTRGLIGIRYKEKDKFTYNHSDSNPEELGVNFLESVKKFNINQIKNGRKKTKNKRYIKVLVNI